MLELPPHLTLSIHHNEHKNYYQTVEEYLPDCERGTWVPGDSRERAIADNEMWSIQVYPRTPIGSYTVFGRTIEEILNYLNESKD